MGSMILPPHSKIIGGAPIVYVYTKYSWINAGFSNPTGDSLTQSISGFNLGDPCNAGDGKLVVATAVAGDFDDVDTPTVSPFTLNSVNFSITNYASPVRNVQTICYYHDSGSALSGSSLSGTVTYSRSVNGCAVEIWYMYYDKAYPPCLFDQTGWVQQTNKTWSGTSLQTTSGDFPASWGAIRQIGTAIADDGDETDTWSWSNGTEDTDAPFSDATEGWTASWAYGSTFSALQPTRTGATSANGRTYAVLYNSTTTAVSEIGTTTGGSDTDVSNSGGTISVTLPGSSADGDHFFVFLTFDASANITDSDFAATVSGTGASAVNLLSMAYGTNRYSLGCWHFVRGSGAPSSFTITNNDTTANITSHQWFVVCARNVHGYYLSRGLFSTNASSSGTDSWSISDFNSQNNTTNLGYRIIACEGTTITGSTPSGWTLAHSAANSEMDAEFHSKANIAYNESAGSVSFAGASTGAVSGKICIW